MVTVFTLSTYHTCPKMCLKYNCMYGKPCRPKWVYTVCKDLSVPKLRVCFTVNVFYCDVSLMGYGTDNLLDNLEFATAYSKTEEHDCYHFVN